MSDFVDNNNSMIHATSEVLHSETIAWGTDTIVNAILVIIDAGMVKIGSLEQLVILGSGGATAITDQKREETMTPLMKILKGLKAYAQTNNDAKLLLFASTSKSTIGVMKAYTFSYFVTAVYAIASDPAIDLVPHQVTSADITSLNTKNLAFLPTIQKKAYAKGNVKYAHYTLSNEIRDLKKLMREKLDAQIFTYEDTFPQSVFAYKSARKVHHPGIRHKDDHCGIELNILNFESEAIENGVTIEILNTGESQLSTSDAKTLLNFKKEGNYILRFTKPGFKPYEDDFDLTKGVTISVDILLEPEEPATPTPEA